MAKPLYTTRIEASGPSGNIFVVLGTATRMLRELGVYQPEIAKLRTDVMESKSYDEALGHIRKYFPVRVPK